MTQEEFIKYTEKMNKNIANLLKNNEEELAFYSQIVRSFNNVCEKNDRLGKKINGLINEIEQKCKKQKEVIDKAIELLGNYKHYSTPDEKQNSDNEDLVNNAFDILKEVSK